MTAEYQGAEFAAPRLLSVADITVMGRFSKSHLYNMVARGHFPKPCVVMGPRFTRWSALAVGQWFADHINGPTA